MDFNALLRNSSKKKQAQTTHNNIYGVDYRYAEHTHILFHHRRYLYSHHHSIRVSCQVRFSFLPFCVCFFLFFLLHAFCCWRLCKRNAPKHINHTDVYTVRNSTKKVKVKAAREWSMSETRKIFCIFIAFCIPLKENSKFSSIPLRWVELKIPFEKDEAKSHESIWKSRKTVWMKRVVYLSMYSQFSGENARYFIIEAEQQKWMWINATQKNPQFYLIWSFERTKAYLYVPHPHAQNAAHLFFFFFFSSFLIFVGMQGKLIFFLAIV